tara:strand:- start:3079 stop:3936 length:858 start_codon:yes stop_codon:yes gene_type:complete
MDDIFHTDQVNKTIELVKNRKKTVAYIVFLDILFLLVYGFVRGAPGASGFLGKIYDFIRIFLTLTSQQAKELTLELARKVSIITLINQNPLIGKYFYSLLILFILFGIAIYFIYSFMQGSSWYLSFKLMHPLSYKKFIKQFFLVNIPWFLLYTIFLIVEFVNSYRFTILERAGEANPQGLKIFSIILIIIVFYFAIISYSLIGHYRTKTIFKKTFIIGIKNIKSLIGPFILLGIIFTLINYVIIILGNINFLLMLILGILLLFPTITISRIYLKGVIVKFIKHES